MIKYKIRSRFDFLHSNQSLAICKLQFILFFFLVNTTGNVFDKKFSLSDMKKQAQSRLLSRDEVFENWMTNIRWKNFKKKVGTSTLEFHTIPSPIIYYCSCSIF